MPVQRPSHDHDRERDQPDLIIRLRQHLLQWPPLAVTSGLFGVSLVVALVVDTHWPGRFSFAPFWPVPVLCALIAGWRYGVAATVLGALLTRLVTGAPDSAFYAALAIFTVGNAALVLLADSTRRALKYAEAAAAATQESEQRFEVMADSVPLMIWVHDRTGRILFVNRPWEEFFGVTQDDARRGEWRVLVHDEDRAAYIGGFEQAILRRESFSATARVRRADGEWRWVESHGVPRLGSRGELLSFAGTSLDVTERRLLEAEREYLLESERAARSEAETATRAKDDFLATLSHELRTPLSVIVLWSRILARKYGAQEDELRKGLGLIIENGMSLSKLIGDLLEMSRIVAGRVTLDLRPVDAMELIQQAVTSHRPVAEAKQIDLQSEIGPEAKVLYGDPTRLQQVLANLLSNAIKFTPAGGHVLIAAHKRGKVLDIAVRDDGEGIKPEFLQEIFGRFRQADKGSARRHGGLGLGLAIVKQLVELHGGQVRAESPGPGQGATVTVTLPLHESALPQDIDSSGTWRRLDPDRMLEARLEGRRVLAVEDQPDMLESLRHMLLDQGAVVTGVASGVEALELLRQQPGSFDVLVTDIGMPHMDGYELVRRVRHELNLGPQRLPAIALTAYAREEDREHAMQAGFQAHLIKPYQIGQLVTVINQLLAPPDDGDQTPDLPNARASDTA
jgi:PAS domain S-box-containing protein